MQLYSPPHIPLKSLVPYYFFLCSGLNLNVCQRSALKSSHVIYSHFLGVCIDSLSFSSVQLSLLLLLLSHFSRVWLCDPHGLQHARLPCPSLSSGVCSDSWPLSWWWYLTILTSATHFSCSHLSPHQCFFQEGSSSYEVAKVLELQHQHQSFQWIFRLDFL